MTASGAPPTDHATVARVALMRLDGVGWDRIGSGFGVSGAAARRAYARLVGAHRTTAIRRRLRREAMRIGALPDSVRRLLHEPDDADQLLELLASPARRERLEDDAECLQADPDMFVPWDKGASTVDAVKICAACPVRGTCLGDSLLFPIEAVGVWGGLSTNRRKKVRHALEALGMVFPSSSRSTPKRVREAA